MIKFLQEIDLILSYADPDNPYTSVDALEAYDYITAIQEARKLIAEEIQKQEKK